MIKITPPIFPAVCQLCCAFMCWTENGEEFEACGLSLAKYDGERFISPRVEACPSFVLSADCNLEV